MAWLLGMGLGFPVPGSLSPQVSLAAVSPRDANCENWNAGKESVGGGLRKNAELWSRESGRQKTLAWPDWVEASCDWSHEGSRVQLQDIQLAVEHGAQCSSPEADLCHLSRYHGPGLVLVLGPSRRVWQCLPSNGKLESTPAPRKRER